MGPPYRRALILFLSVDIMSPFDFVKDVSFTKHNIFTEDNMGDYIPIIINRAFGYYTDTVMYANEMNIKHHLDKQLQYDFYLHGLRKRKRYSPWLKKDYDDDVEAISQYFQISYAKAKEARKLLSQHDVDKIAEMIERKQDEQSG